MSKAPAVTQIDLKDWTENPTRIVDNLNSFMRDTGHALARGLTVSENMVAQYDDVTLYISDSAPSYPFSFRWQFPGITPRVCMIGMIDSSDGVESVFSAASPRWAYQSGNIVIHGIRANVTSDKRYRITFKTEG